jgi:hypothetical protein
MWIATNWTVTKSALSCAMRRGSTRKIIDFPLPTVILVEVPTSLGTQSECLEILSREWQTSLDQVKHVHSGVYRVVTMSAIPEINFETFKRVKVCEPSVHHLLATHGIRYHTYYNDECEVQDPPSDLKYVPRTCFWCWTGTGSETTIGFATNYTPDVEIFTTVPIQEPQFVAVRHFPGELALLEHLVNQILEHDLDVGYGSRFHGWPQLITRLTALKSKIFEQTGVEILETTDVSTIGTQVTTTAMYPGTDHVDLLRILRVAYPHLPSFELDRVSRHVLNRGSVSGSAVVMMEREVQLIKDLWTVLQPCYAHIVETTGVKYSDVGSAAEVEGFLMHYRPDLLLGPKVAHDRLHQPYFDLGMYRNVYVYNLGPLMVEALQRGEDDVTREMGEHMSRYPFPWTIKAIYLNPQLQPGTLVGGDVTIGMTGSLVFTTAKLPFETIQTHELLTAIASGSWISRNGDNFEYFGVAKACRPLFPLVTKGIELLITSYMNRILVPNLKSYITDIPVTPDDLIITCTMTEMNDTFRDVLSPAAIAQLQAGIPVGVKYVKLVEGRLVSAEQWDPKVQTADLEFYSTTLYRILQRIPTM